MLPACTASQKPYVIGHANSTNVYSGATGDSPPEACISFFATATPHPSLTITNVTQFQCVISNSTIVYPVRKVCDDSPQLTPDKIADMALLWGLFLVAAIIITCLKKFSNIFESAPHGE